MRFNVADDPWQVLQTDGHLVTLDLEQDDASGNLSGIATTADFVGTVVTDEREGGVSRVSGSQFFLLIKWHHGALGEMNGTFGLDGRLTGHSFDRNHPENQAGFFSYKTF